jgi:DNA processing protein
MNQFLLLAVAEGCGPGMVPALLDPAADPGSLLARPPGDLPAAALRRLAAVDLGRRAQAWLDAARRSGLEVWTPDDPRYPGRLREAPLRPLCLFAGGRGEAAAGRAVAVVGSRTPTAYGLAATRDFTRACAEAGFAIWSGLAFGVDAAAHEAALEAGAPTVAVLAGGLDRPHPAAHQGLARRILAAGGLCLSEAPPGLRPTRGHFPRRNRILAGSVEAVLVVEAGERSGALHTARFAADAGVAVFAVPGPYTSPRSRGCHRLIAEGAAIAVDPGTLLAELGLEVSLHGDGDRGNALQLSGDEQRIVATLLAGPRPIDSVARESGLGEDRFLEVVYGLLGRGALLRLTGDLLAIGRS